MADDEIVKEDDDEERPAFNIAPKDRKLIAQPFDFIVGSLEKQVEDGDLVLQDDFQRRQVWDDKKASRLIESLLLNVPIPVCYFAELDDGSYSVIDGQQRLTSVWRYLTNQLALSGLRVRPELNKKRFVELDKVDRRLITTRTIRCIVIQKESHPEIRFDVFERLNSASVKLTPQELRNSNFRGKLNKLIIELCEDKTFQKIRRTDDIDARMSDAEMILRFFAFHFNGVAYKGVFAPFLDAYLSAGQHMPDNEIDQHRVRFINTVGRVDAVFGRNAFRQIDASNNYASQINRAIFDIIMLSFAHITRDQLIGKKDEIVAELKDLCLNDAVFQDAIGRATRDRTRLNNRARLWVERLRKIGLQCPDLKFGN